MPQAVVWVPKVLPGEIREPPLGFPFETLGLFRKIAFLAAFTGAVGAEDLESVVMPDEAEAAVAV